jgi:hypothetical protein
MKFYNLHESLAKTVDQINGEQTFINSVKDKIKNKKTVDLSSQYYNALEALRSTLLSTKQKSIFADEKKLREDISESYGLAVSGQQRPSNTVIEAAEDLSVRVDKAKEDVQKLKTEYRNKLDKALLKEKIDVNINP